MEIKYDTMRDFFLNITAEHRYIVEQYDETLQALLMKDCPDREFVCGYLKGITMCESILRNILEDGVEKNIILKEDALIISKENTYKEK